MSLLDLAVGDYIPLTLFHIDGLYEFEICWSLDSSKLFCCLTHITLDFAHARSPRFVSMICGEINKVRYVQCDVCHFTIILEPPLSWNQRQGQCQSHGRPTSAITKLVVKPRIIDTVTSRVDGAVLHR